MTNLDMLPPVMGTYAHPHSYFSMPFAKVSAVFPASAKIVPENAEASLEQVFHTVTLICKLRKSPFLLSSDIHIYILDICCLSCHAFLRIEVTFV
ncbi:MAG: hypothetical protein LKE40_13455 [Spirochaetia bacterium]|nr:hypothetical protein [Spirochaetia bacterium]